MMEKYLDLDIIILVNWDLDIYGVFFPVLISSLENIKMISCGANHTLALRNDGKVFGFGNNYFGQLSLGHRDNVYSPVLISSLENIKVIASKINHSLVLRDDGKVFSFG